MSYAFADLDVSRPLAAVTLGPGDEGAAVLVRRGGRPLGLVLRRLAAGTVLSPASVSQLLADELRVALVCEAITDELRPPVEREPPSVTVVHGEPGDRALREAATPWVAFVATGARLDAQWSAGLGEAIAEQPDAAAVTGLVLPAELSTAAAVAFEQAGGLHLGFEKRRFAGHVRLEPPLQPVETWGLGSVGNLAVRRDAALAAGGAGAGAGDLLLRLLRAGHAVAYEPRMLVFHTHGPSATGPRLVSQAARLARPGVEHRGAALRALAWTGVRRLRRGSARVSGFEPRDVVHVDLEVGTAGLSPAPDRDVFAVLWWRDIPLGHVEASGAELACPAATAERIAAAIAPAVGDRVLPTGFEQPAPSRVPVPLSPPPSLADLLALERPLERAGIPEHPSSEDPAATSIIVCTRGRPDDLGRALAALGRAEPGPGEILVVDNDPGDGRTRAAVDAFGGARYVAEPRPGLSVARNSGIRAARGSVLAFVDDDTAVHPRWLERLLAGFESPEVLAVTGLVLPAELSTRAQVVFESTMGGARRGYRRMVFGRDFFDSQTPFGVPVWAIGAGANMAFRREAFERVGLFDERLGAGATGCSEDSELWYRLLAAGHECRYAPASVVLHWHRRDMDALRRQAHDYLRGHVAALFVQYAKHRHRGNLRRVALTMPKHLLRRALSEAALGPEARTGLLGSEVQGYVAGLREWRLALRR